jgi:hypothetical protein
MAPNFPGQAARLQGLVALKHGWLGGCSEPLAPGIDSQG